MITSDNAKLLLDENERLRGEIRRLKELVAYLEERLDDMREREFDDDD